MKRFFALIATAWAAVFKKVTSNDVLVQVPQINISQATINHVIDIVNNVKRVVESPITILVTDLIPGTLDNDIAKLIDEAIVPTMAGLTFCSTWLRTVPPPDRNVLVNDLLNKVHFSDDADKNALYHSLAARLIMVASDGKVTWSEAASLIEFYFKQVFGTNSTPTN